MEEETGDKGWSSDLLSQSYSEGIERIIGTSKDTVHTFEVPQQLIEERTRFWNGFFSKYSEELSDEVELDLNTLQPAENIEENYDSPKQRVPMRKSPSLIQYWVNTGNLPYGTLNKRDIYSDSGSSLSEEELLQSPNSPERMNLLETGENRIEKTSNSSCSSVDTAAYILSNTNITKKAETMAIVEGARYSDSVANKSINTGNVECMCPADTASSTDKDNTQQSNSNNNSQCFPITKISKSVQDASQNTLQTPNIKKVYTVPDYDITFQASPECKSEVTDDNAQSDIDGSQYKNNISVLKQFVVKTSKSVLYDKDSVPWTACEAETDEMNSELKDDLLDTIFDSDKKLLHRKKLYSGRDSPVDLIRIKRTSTNRIDKPKKSLHPALDSSVTINRRESLLRRRKRHEKKRQKWSELVSKKLASLNNSSQESHNGRHSLINLNELEENSHCSEQLEDTSINDLSQNKNQKSIDTDNDEPEEAIFSVTSGEKGTSNGINTESRNDIKINKNNVANKLERNLNCILRPVVYLTRLSDTHKNKGISQKEMVSDKIKNAVVRLTRIPLSEIEKYKSSKNTMNKGDDVVLHMQLRKGSLGSNSLKRNHNRGGLRSCEIQNINMEDVDSDQSTVFLCECKYGSVRECSTSESSSSINSNSPDVMSHLTENNSPNNSRQSVKRSTAFKQPPRQTKIRKTGTSKILRNNRSKENVEILNRIKQLKPVVVLERLPQERLRNIRIKRNTRNILSSKKKAESQGTAKSFEVTNTLLHTSSKAVEQDKESHRSTHARTRLQLGRRNTLSPIKKHTSTELSRKQNYTTHHSVVNISSDDETEFVELIQNFQNSKRSRLRSQPELHASNVTQANVLDTTDDESDKTLVNTNTTEKRLAKNGFTRKITRRTRKFSASQKTDSENDTSSKKKLLGSARRATSNTSSSEYSGNIFTSTRKNSNAVPPSSTEAIKSHSMQTVLCDKSFNNVRTPKQNGNISPKKSSIESVRKFDKCSSERNNKANGSKEKFKTPITRLRFRTRIFESDSESISMSSNHSLVSEDYSMS